MWRFDFITCEWHLVRSAGGAPPAPRTNHCACVCDDVMFVFGGKVRIGIALALGTQIPPPCLPAQD